MTGDEFMDMQKIIIITLCIMLIIIVCNIISTLDIISTLIGCMIGYFLGSYIENRKRDNENNKIL